MLRGWVPAGPCRKAAGWGLSLSSAALSVALVWWILTTMSGHTNGGSFFFQTGGPSRVGLGQLTFVPQSSPALLQADPGKCRFSASLDSHPQPLIADGGGKSVACHHEVTPGKVPTGTHTQHLQNSPRMSVMNQIFFIYIGDTQPFILS